MIQLLVCDGKKCYVCPISECLPGSFGSDARRWNSIIRERCRAVLKTKIVKEW